MKKTLIFASLIFSQLAIASESTFTINDFLESELNETKKSTVVVNIISSADLKLTKSFKKDLIFYLNRKYKDLSFTFDSKETGDVNLEINLSNLSIKHFNIPKTEVVQQLGVAARKKETPKKFESIEESGVLSNSVIVFNSQINFSNSNENNPNTLISNYLISPDGINKNNNFISVNDIYKTVDFDFIDFIKQDNYINTQEIGFTNGLNGSSGFSDNNINISNRQNDFKAKMIIFALVFKEIETIIER